jgi:hypothetical protein
MGLGKVPVDEPEAAPAGRGDGNLAIPTDSAAVTADHDRPLASAEASWRPPRFGQRRPVVTGQRGGTVIPLAVE